MNPSIIVSVNAEAGMTDTSTTGRPLFLAAVFVVDVVVVVVAAAGAFCIDVGTDKPKLAPSAAAY